MVKQPEEMSLSNHQCSLKVDLRMKAKVLMHFSSVDHF